MPKSKFLTFFPQPSFPVVVPPTHYQSQKPRVIFDSSPSPPIHQVLLLPPPKSGHFISPQLVFHSSPPAPSFPGYSINRTAGVPASILDLFSSVFQSIWNKHLDFSWLLGTALTSAYYTVHSVLRGFIDQFLTLWALTFCYSNQAAAPISLSIASL